MLIEQPLAHILCMHFVLHISVTHNPTKEEGVCDYIFLDH